MARERKLVLNPPADLEPRAGDVWLPLDCFLEISLFARLKKKPNVERFPGTLVLRRYRRGEIICRQGEAGWTAFYALTGDDLLTLRLDRGSRIEHRGSRIEEKAIGSSRPDDAASLRDPRSSILDPRSPLGAGTPRPVATVHLVLGPGTASAAPGMLSRLGGRLLRALGRADEPARRWLPRIPISNQRDVCPETRQATLYEGELFGEMSCMYGAPRSAT